MPARRSRLHFVTLRWRAVTLHWGYVANRRRVPHIGLRGRRLPPGPSCLQYSEPKPPKRGTEKNGSSPSPAILIHAISFTFPVTNATITSSRCDNTTSIMHDRAMQRTSYSACTPQARSCSMQRGRHHYSIDICKSLFTRYSSRYSRRSRHSIPSE